MYAYGEPEFFAVEAGSYMNFLLEERDREDREEYTTAILSEIDHAKEYLLETQEQLREIAEHKQITSITKQTNHSESKETIQLWLF